MQTRIFSVLVAAALSASCSGAIAPPPPAPTKTVIDTQLKALDKAKAVQQTVDQQKVDMDKKMDAAEGATADPGKRELMPTPREIAELVALDKEVEKETVRKLRDNRRVEFAVQFSSYAQKRVDQVRDEVVRKGVHFDCRKGCAWCCHFAVDAFPQETFRIARELKGRGDTTATIAALSAYVERTKASTTFRRSVPCPFLVDDACSVYLVRPMMCRKCNSLDVEKCKDPTATVPESPELAHKTGAIVHGTIKAYERNKLPTRARGLVPSVLLALTDADAERRWHAGEDVFAGPGDAHDPAAERTER